MDYRAVLAKRRSVYSLKPTSPVADDLLINRLEEVLDEAPSAFNAQSPRLVICLGTAHKAVWEITKDALRKIVPPEKFKNTESKLNMFENAYGTLLLYTETKTVDKLKADYPLYANIQDQWADHNIGIVLIDLWDTLVDLGLAANLQHYNPLIDAEVQKKFAVPSSWRLEGEIVFGTEGFAPSDKEKLAIESRVILAK